MEFVEELLAQAGTGQAVLTEGQAKGLRTKKTALEEKRQALYLTLGKFEPRTDPRAVGSSQDWLKLYGRTSSKSAHIRYLQSLLR